MKHFSESDVKSRIKEIFNYKKSGFWIAGVVMAALLSVAILLISDQDKSVFGSLNTSDDPGTTSIVKEDNQSKELDDMSERLVDRDSSSDLLPVEYKANTNQPKKSAVDSRIFIDKLDKETDESINYVYTTSPDDIVVDSIHYGSFTGIGKSEILVIFKLLHMPHAGGLDCSVAAVYDGNSMDIISQKTFGMDECRFSLLKDEKSREMLLFVGSTTYQGHSVFTLGLWEMDKTWKQIFPENPNIYDYTTKKLELKDGQTVSVSRPIPVKGDGDLAGEITWMFEYDLKWNKTKRTMEKIIPKTFKDSKGKINVGVVSRSPDKRFAISTYIEEFDGEYKVMLYDTVKNTLKGSFDMLAGQYGFLWSPDSKKVCVTKTARIWQDINIIDTRTNKVVVIEDIYNKIKKIGGKLDYALNENRPDPMLAPVKWVSDSKKVLVSYQWRDTEYKIQSGTFMFDMESRSISKVVQNPPTEEG